MRPDKSKTGLENFIDLVIASNPEASLTPNQIFVDAILEDTPVEGRVTVDVNANQGLGYKDQVTVTYGRYGLEVYVSEGEVVELNGSETIQQVINLLADQIDLISTELDLSSYTLPQVTGPQYVDLDLETVTNSIIYNTSSVPIRLIVAVPDTELRVTPDSRIRVTPDGIVRRIHTPQPV